MYDPMIVNITNLMYNFKLLLPAISEEIKQNKTLKEVLQFSEMLTPSLKWLKILNVFEGCFFTNGVS